MIKKVWNEIKKYWAAIVVAMFVILCCFILYKYYASFYKNGLSADSSKWGIFGEYVGGVVGTILSFISVILIYATYTNQVKNSIQQQFETTFFNLLQNQREILKSMKGLIDTTPNVLKGEKELVLYKEASKYIDTISHLINRSFDGAPGHFTDQQGGKKDFFIDEKASYKIINKSYNEIFKGKEAELGHYFRHLYHILKYVVESSIQNKKKYIDIIQAQMSDNELYVTFNNGISEYGNKRFLPILDKYHFFENIRSRGEIFDKIKNQFYPNTSFKYNAERNLD